MLADKVETHRRALVQALGPIRVAVKFASEHYAITGGTSSDLEDAIEALETFEERLGRVAEGLRRLENAN